MNLIRALAIWLLAAFATPALADFTFTQGSGATAFDFTCFTTKHCFAHVNIASNGDEILGINVGTVASPGTDVLTTQPAILFPASSTPITASATGTTGATTATLAATSGKTTYICGFFIGADATAATVGTGTITGTITGTLSFRQGVGAAASATATTRQEFYPCIPASATNTAIALVSIAAGTGGNTAEFAWGYQQ